MPGAELRRTSPATRVVALLGLLAAVVIPQASAVDRSKFRTCEQGSFCRRFRQWIKRPEIEKPLWTIFKEKSENVGGGEYHFQVKHVHEATPHLLLRVNAYSSGIVRFRLGEIDPVHKRHEIPVGDAIADPPPVGSEKVDWMELPEASVLSFETEAGAKVKVEIRHSPLAMAVAVNGQIVQRLNSRNFLTFERYRKPKELRPPDELRDAAVVIDSAAHPHDLDTKGLWEEDFGGHTDRKPRGPAALGMDLTFEGGVPGLFGLPEHGTKASLPFYDEPYRFYNLDVFEYEIGNPMALYGAVPLLWAIHNFPGSKPVTTGFLWLNPSETFVKLERASGEGPKNPAHVWWVSESGVLDASVLVGPAPPTVSGQFHALTGLGAMPALWALGKHQCRWNYMTQKDVAQVDAGFDKHDIPYDVMWLDIEHTDGKAYFSWNSANFPEPGKMIQSISDKRRKFVNVVDPHIKKDEKFHVFREVRDKGLFIKKIDWKMMDDPSDVKPADWVEIEKIPDPNATIPEGWSVEDDGQWEAPKIPNPEYKGVWHPRQITDPTSPQTDFEGWCWPGTSLYPDFADPAMRDYWGSQFALDKYTGTNADTYVWNDMNEPSVFNGPEVTMPRDAIHPYGNVEHRDLHNMYGYYVHRATYEGLQKRVPNDRPFVLTRSFFVGSHKYAAIWTGDNYAKWDHLQASIAMVGALTLSGQSLVGADVGGFFKHPDNEMLVRWYQLAVLAYPFLRNHAHLETPRREPFVFDDETMGLVKDSLQLRYRMLPVWYTLFADYHRKGEPVVRPLFWDYLSDPNTHTDEDALENEIMLGNVLLVRGVTKPMTEADKGSVYLPVTPGGWYDLYTGDNTAPGRHEMQFTLQSIPAYFRAGTVVPMKSRVRRSSSCTWQDPFTLKIYLDPTSGTATGRLYIDDYKTTQYQDGKSFLEVEFEFKSGTLKASSMSGSLTDIVSTEVERVEIFGLRSPPTSAVLSQSGAQHTLPKPNTRQITTWTSTTPLHTAVVKVSPWIDLRTTGWELKVA
mmetsp:Transcript_15366/g.33773  ORF Transcript_15366/g.33773 Transcript_15366/m.33773 type:complete len:1019 (-) Transcript_15366:265-3321(-)